MPETAVANRAALESEIAVCCAATSLQVHKLATGRWEGILDNISLLAANGLHLDLHNKIHICKRRACDRFVESGSKEWGAIVSLTPVDGPWTGVAGVFGHISSVALDVEKDEIRSDILESWLTATFNDGFLRLFLALASNTDDLNTQDEREACKAFNKCCSDFLVGFDIDKVTGWD